MMAVKNEIDIEKTIMEVLLEAGPSYSRDVHKHPDLQDLPFGYFWAVVKKLEKDETVTITYPEGVLGESFLEIR